MNPFAKASAESAPSDANPPFAKVSAESAPPDVNPFNERLSDECTAEHAVVHLVH